MVKYPSSAVEGFINDAVYGVKDLLSSTHSI